ncbi:hypothetical protein P12x_002739 [Tundrisphaera lichenicola]|uniref:hypothetical protein n=1 Tax=Tundrisphaera lichenicola TaxID=2029860 RepID=UPI003EBED092
MPNEYLATYLNDHLAGSEAALELLDHLDREHSGTPIAMLTAGLREDITADRRELEALMARLGIDQSSTRKATAWLSAKATQLKLKLDDPAGGKLRLLEILDALSVGIEGKRLLWRALKTAAITNADLRGTDYQALEHRADDQRLGIEPFRLGAAKGTFGTGLSS